MLSEVRLNRKAAYGIKPMLLFVSNLKQIILKVLQCRFPNQQGVFLIHTF